MKRRIPAVAAILLVCVLFSSAFSQTINATLGGTVRDATGALIPGVTVTATNVRTGIVSTVLTNDSGVYQFASLQPGAYNIQTELPAFQTAITRDFQLAGAQQARLNFTLEVGGVEEIVEVTAESGSLLATTASSIGDVLPEYRLRDIPLANRDVLALVAATAGVQSTGGERFGNIAGARLGAVNTTRDGMNVADGRFDTGAFSITHTSPDLVEEVSVVTSTVSSETARGSGQISMVTRSGGNQFSGSAFWANENSALGANNWFDNFNKVEKSYGNRNQFGIRLGGPIVRNRTFFFMLYEGQRNLMRENAVGSTLTGMARDGIFRYFPGADNRNAVEPNATVDRDGNAVRPTNATGDLAAIDLFGNCTFRGAAVPNCRTFRDPLRPAVSTSSYIQETLRRMPSPNEFTTGDGLNTAAIRFVRRIEGIDGGTGGGTGANRDQYNLRLDHQFGINHRLGVILTREHNSAFTAQSGMRQWPDGFDGQRKRDPSVYTLTATSNLSTSVLNMFRMGRRKSIERSWGAPNRPDEIGAEALQFVPFANGVPFRPQPQLWTSFVLYGGFGRWREHHSPMYTMADDISWIRGQHSFKGGLEFRHVASDGMGDPQFTPQANLGAGANPVAGLDGTVFQGLTANSASTARSLLTDLAGSIASVGQSFGILSSEDRKLVGSPTMPGKFFRVYQREIGAYFRDEWKATPNLTLNLGIRWDWYGQPVETAGVAARMVGNDRNALTAITCTSSPGTPGFRSECSNLTEVDFAGKNSTNPDRDVNLQGDDWNNFAPTVGFAYDVPWLTRPTVVRGGYSISIVSALRDRISVDGVLGTVPGINFVSGSQGLQWSPATGAYTSISTLQLPIPFPTGTSTESPFTVPVTDRTLTIQTYDYVDPYIQNWNLQIQRELARNTTLEARYIGSKGTKLFGIDRLNQIDGLRRSRVLFDAFNAVRAGGESLLLDQMLMGINLGGQGARAVDGVTWTGANAVRTNTTTRNQIAGGDVGAFINFLNTNTTGTGSADRGAILRRNGFPENYIVPNPQYSGVDMRTNMGNSTYHAMQLQVTRGLSSGFTSTTSWTWSKALGEADSDDGANPRDPGNRSIEKRLLGYDHAHQITSNGSWELPFGTGRPFMGSAPGWLDQVIGDWQLSGILNWNSGAPLSLTSGRSTISTTSAMANIVGEFPKSSGRVTKMPGGVPVYFDGFTQVTDPGISNITDKDGLRAGYNLRAIVAPNGEIVLVNPQPGDPGSGQAWIKGPSNLRFDMNMRKQFPIGERMNFEFRLDAINVLNSPNFGNPNTNINDAAFGQITSASGQRIFVINARINF